jgi:hypothetical protein
MKNHHIIRVKYYGATNTNGSRVGIISDRFRERVTIPYDYSFNTSYEIAVNWLKNNGFNVIGIGEGLDCSYVITDTFKPLKAH